MDLFVWRTAHKFSETDKVNILSHIFDLLNWPKTSAQLLVRRRVISSKRKAASFFNPALTQQQQQKETVFGIYGI